MRKYDVYFTRQAVKDTERLSPRLRKKLKKILSIIISNNPYSGKPLIGDLKGSYSYRLSYQDRIVYSIDEDKKRIYIERTKTHYGD